MTGPIQKTYQSLQKPEASCGPKARAGFIAAPVSGPPTRISIITVRPMPKPPILGARASTAVPNTASTKKKVNTASRKMAVPTETPGASAGEPRWVTLQMDSGKTARRARPASVPDELRQDVVDGR